MSSQGDTEAYWTILSPDGGLYQIGLNSPKDELAANVALVKQALGSLQRTSWEPPPTITNGVIHEDPGRAFSFDYPAGWVRYYPTDLSTGSSPVVTVASSPLQRPCTDDTHPVASGAPPVAPCGSFTLPPATIAIEFRIGGFPPGPDWSKANMTIGGQPAFGPDKGKPGYAAGGKEGYGWEVRVQDQLNAQDVTAVSIDASLNGPSLTELRSAMNLVIDSIRVTAP